MAKARAKGKVHQALSMASATIVEELGILRINVQIWARDSKECATIAASKGTRPADARKEIPKAANMEEKIMAKVEERLEAKAMEEKDTVPIASNGDMTIMSMVPMKITNRARCCK